LGGGLGEGEIAPPEFEKEGFFVFLPSQFYFFHILPPPPRKLVKILAPPEKN